MCVREYMLHSVHGHVSVCGHALYRAIHGHRVAIHGHGQLCATGSTALGACLILAPAAAREIFLGKA